MNRRKFLQQAAAASLALPSLPSLYAQDAPRPLPPWQPGMLDIHHINTGRGNATLILAPDGTSILIDAGAANTPVEFLNPARPDASRRPGQWIARYIQRFTSAIDTAVITHLHVDHMGGLDAASPVSAHGNYRLTGMSDVAEAVPIRRLIDRGFPEYSYPAPQANLPEDLSVQNYMAFARSLAARGVPVEALQPGSNSQIHLVRQPEAYPEFSIRNLAANGQVWTGSGNESKACFPPLAGMLPKQLPSENMCSIALRIDYGRFRYYTGSDLTCDTDYGRSPWRDIETPVAQAAGPVHVATVNHHGRFDAAGPAFVEALRPKTWVLPSWHVSHPSLSVLANLYSGELYPGPRQVYCTGIRPEAYLTTTPFSEKLRNRDGHVLVRVSPGGNIYGVFVLDALGETAVLTAPPTYVPL